jgi:hypothetical protein
MNGLRVGKVAFGPLPSESGVTVPVAFGTLAWKNGDIHGMTVFIKAAFDMTASPMKIANPEPIAAMDIVPRKQLVDVVVSPHAKARAGETAIVIQQRGSTLLDVKRSAVVGKSHGLEPVFATPGTSDAMQCALVDQRVPALDPDAHFYVAGVFADRPSITTQLPSARAVGVLFGVNPNGPEHPTILAFKADTLFIDPSAHRLSIVWRAEVPLHKAFDMGLLTVGAGVATHDHPLRLRKRLQDLAVEARQGRAASPMTEVLPQSGPVSSTPVGGGTQILGREGMDAALAKKPPARKISTSRHRQELKTVITQIPPEQSKGKALPFDSSAKVAVPASRAASTRAEDKGGTLPIGSSRRDGVPGANFADKQKTIPFVTEKDRQRARALEEAAEQDRLERTKKADADRAQAEKRADEERAAEERRVEARRAFEAEQVRLRKLEADRKDHATQAAKEQAQKLDEGLYGGFGKKKK